MEGGKGILGRLNIICKGPKTERLWSYQNKAYMAGFLLIPKLLPSLLLDQTIFITMFSILNNAFTNSTGCMYKSQLALAEESHHMVCKN